MTEVLAYVRVSTTRQGVEGLGADAQRDAIERAAARRDWNVVGWFEDEKSGKSLEREGIQEALKQLENGGPKVLVAAKLDRIARSAIDFLTLVQRARDHGWQLVVLDLDVDMTTSMGRMIAGILAQVAEFERHLIVERTTGALEQAASQGRPHGGVRPFGFQEGDRITHVEAEANLIREAARRVLEGDSISSICNEWNESEVGTSLGGTWRPRTLRGILESPRIMGKRSHGESLYDAQWEAIIDEATWRKLQTTFRGRRRGPNRDSHLLSGILRCDECGDSLAIGYVRKRRVYRTHNQGQNPASCGHARSIDADMADLLIRDVIVERLHQGVRPSEGTTDLAGHTEAEEELAHVRARLDEVNDMFASGEMNRAERARVRGRLLERQGQLEQQLSRLVAPGLPEGVPADKDELLQAWETSDNAWRRRVIQALVEEIAVKPGTTGQGSCLQCGSVIEGKGRQAKYCSNACTQKAYEARKLKGGSDPYQGLSERLRPVWSL